MDNAKPLFGRSTKKTPVVSFERAKIPPQAVDLEEVVLGAMMIDKKGVDSVIDILHENAFYIPNRPDLNKNEIKRILSILNS